MTHCSVAHRPAADLRPVLFIYVFFFLSALFLRLGPRFVSENVLFAPGEFSVSIVGRLH